MTIIHILQIIALINNQTTTFMHRFALDYLSEWKDRPSRKPIVIRGARQVGKSFLVRMLAERCFESIATVNFERDPDLGELFENLSPQRILPGLELRLGTSIQPGKTLLFLDEIQVAPWAFASLRYFLEEMSGLHVIAAGSLLEFVLEEHSFSMPVGRIEYLHLGPMNFEEYLLATGRRHMTDFLREYALGKEIPGPVHAQFLRAIREYAMVGGMPEAVAAHHASGSFLECGRVQQSILSTYADDFSKYASRVNVRRLQKVFQKLPGMVGMKFKHSLVDREEQARDIGKALHLLCMARVAHKIIHSACNGVPLGAEEDDRRFKVLLMDVGLMCKACGLNLIERLDTRDTLLVNAGPVCEQLIGQQILHSGPFFEEPRLHYWSREKPQSSAEVDYVVSIDSTIIPVEVKAGKTGALRSLHVFLKEKRCRLAVRFNAELPSSLETQSTLSNGETIQYKLISLPLYLSGQMGRILRGGHLA